MQSSFQLVAILLEFHLCFLWVKHSEQEFSGFPAGWGWGGGCQELQGDSLTLQRAFRRSHILAECQRSSKLRSSFFLKKNTHRVGHDWATEPPPQEGLLKNTLLNINKTHITENAYKTEVWHSELSSGNSLWPILRSKIGLCQLPSSPFMGWGPAAYHSSFLSSEITTILRWRATISCSSFWFYHPSVHPETLSFDLIHSLKSDIYFQSLLIYHLSSMPFFNSL